MFHFYILSTAMAFRIITIPFSPEKEIFAEEDLNSFLLNKHLKSWQAQFFTKGEKAYWTVFLEYENGVPRAKNTEKLSEPQALLYQRLREWRKEKADAGGVPVFLVATNQELLSVVKQAPQSLEALKNIRGFGNKKIEKYGKELIKLIQTFYRPEK